MTRTLEGGLLEQVQALKSKIDEVMASRTDKEDDYGNFMQSGGHTEPEPMVPESSQVLVVADVHEPPKYEDEEEPSVEVVQADEVAQAGRMDEHGVEV